MLIVTGVHILRVLFLFVFICLLCVLFMSFVCVVDFIPLFVFYRPI